MRGAGGQSTAGCGVYGLGFESRVDAARLETRILNHNYTGFGLWVLGFRVSGFGGRSLEGIISPKPDPRT